MKRFFEDLVGFILFLVIANFFFPNKINELNGLLDKYVWPIFGEKTSCDIGQEFVDYTDSNFGYSLEYPKNWFTNAYTPNERLGTGGTPEYMLAISNVAGDFGRDAAALDNTLVRISFARHDNNWVDPSGGTYVPFEVAFPDIKIEKTEETVKINGRDGVITTRTDSESFWITKSLVVKVGGYEYWVDAAINKNGDPSRCSILVENLFQKIVFPDN